MRKMLVVFLAATVLAVQAWSGERNAKITRVAGKAEIFKAGEWNEARVGAVIAPGEAVRAVDGGEVGVETMDGAISLNGANGAVIEYDGTVDGDVVPWKSAGMARSAGRYANGSATQQFSVPAGDVEFRVRTGEPLRVVTPLLTAAVRGTRFAMRVTADGSSSLDLREGAVDGYDRTGVFRQITPGGFMTLASSDFASFLETRGVKLSPGQDWRTLSPSVLEAVDNATFSGRFSQIYYNPVVGQVLKSAPGLDGVDESKVAKAAYIGDATLDDILANPDSNPFAPEWLDDLASNPMTETENSHLNNNYHPGNGNSIANPAPGGDAGLTIGNGYVGDSREQNGSDIAWGNLDQGGNPSIGAGGSSLIEDGLPDNEIAGLPNSDPSGIPDLPPSGGGGGGGGNAFVKGTLSGANVNGGGFRFNLNLDSGQITNGEINGSGKDGATRVGFGLQGGSGTYAGNSFNVGYFQSGNVGGVSDAFTYGNSSFNGTASNGLGQRGDSVSGGFTVQNGTHSVSGNISGNRVQ